MTFQIASGSKIILVDNSINHIRSSTNRFETWQTWKTSWTKLGCAKFPLKHFIQRPKQSRIFGEPYTNEIEKLDFKINDIGVESYSIVIKSKAKNTNCGILYIPGSGTNVSTAVVKASSPIYRDTALVMAEYCDVFVYVKPLQDFRAVHDGNGKQSGKGMMFDPTAYGGSYSSRYIIESIAWSKYLERTYQQYGIAGLSQGGGATLITSLQVEPDFAIVSSGYTIASYQNYYSTAEGNVNIPGYFAKYSLSKTKEILKNQSTSYLFTYGENESIPAYVYEAKSGRTCDFLWEANPEIVCFVHKEGHIFPNERVRTFLEQVTQH